MRRVFLILCVLCIVSSFSCGGGSSSNVSSDDVNAISAALTSTMTDCMGEIEYSSVNCDELLMVAGGSFSKAVNIEHSCPVDGRITATGNMSGSWTDSGSGSYNAMITFQVSDPTNNLNDCEVGSGIILDGSLILTLTGSYSAAGNTFLATLIGTIGINERGPTGGLVMVASDCYISLRFTETGASGTICGHSVSATVTNY